MVTGNNISRRLIINRKEKVAGWACLIGCLPGYECAKVSLQISSILLTATWPFVKPFKPYRSESLVFFRYTHEVQVAGRSGRAACGLAARWISGNDGFHEEPLYQACNDEVSWLLQWQARSYELPLWPAVFVELFHQLIYGQFALYVPFLLTQKSTNNFSTVIPNTLFLARYFLIGYKLCNFIG